MSLNFTWYRQSETGNSFKANLSIFCINIEISCFVIFISEHDQHGVTMVVETGTLEGHVHVGEGNSTPVDTVLYNRRWGGVGLGWGGRGNETLKGNG